MQIVGDTISWHCFITGPYITKNFARGVTMVETIVVNLRYCYCCHLIDWQQAGAHEKGWNWFGASLLSFLAVFIGNIQKYSKISLIYKPLLRNPVYAPVADGNLLLRTSSKADILNSPKLALKDSPTGGATPLHSTPLPLSLWNFCRRNHMAPTSVRQQRSNSAAGDLMTDLAML